MDIIKLNRIDGLVDSLIELERQAETLQDAIASGTKRWGGETPKSALINTAKAMILDAGKLQDLQGADAWNEEKKQVGFRILRELTE